MIVKKCAFNPVVDKTPVSDTGFVDLKTAFVNNSIPSQVSGSDSDYNGIDDPGSILGKPSDVFEAMEMESYIKDSSSSANSEDSANS